MIQINPHPGQTRQMAARATWKGNKMNKTTLLSAVALVALTATGAMAQSKGDMTLGFGIATVNPAEDI